MRVAALLTQGEPYKPGLVVTLASHAVFLLVGTPRVLFVTG